MERIVIIAQLIVDVEEVTIILVTITGHAKTGTEKIVTIALVIVHVVVEVISAPVIITGHAKNGMEKIVIIALMIADVIVAMNNSIDVHYEVHKYY
jgi:hypothetical protein